MNGPFFFSFLNPAVGLLLAGVFAALWLQQREKRFIAMIAAGYAVSSVAFVLQDIGPALHSWPNRLASNSMFLLAGSLIAAGTVRRYARPVPYMRLATIAVGAMAGVCWFLLVKPDLTGRIYIVNFALGAIALLTVFILGKVEKNHVVDHIILAVWLLLAANFTVSTIVVVQLGGPYETYDGFQYSLYWTSKQVSQAVLSVMLALSLIVATTFDIVVRLKHVSLTDELSGLLNRRGFYEAAKAAYARCRVGGRPCALAIADLDHFKMINDTYGHAAGDRAIVAFADLLRTSTPEGAVIGRVGGEEFAIFMPGMTLSAARLFCEGIRIATGTIIVPAAPAARLSASFGVSALATDDTLAAAATRADEALYRAKDDGRDRVRTEDVAQDMPGARAWTS